MKIKNQTQYFISTNFIVILRYSFFAILFFLDPMYGTTDDYILDSWLNGTYTEKSENELIFVSSIFSNFVNYLYKLYLQFPWYAAILMFLNLVCYLYISLYIQKKFEKNQIFNMLLQVILFSYVVWVYLNITYTATAVILAISGLLAFNRYLTDKKGLQFGISILFFNLAYIVRPEAIFSIIIFLIIFILVHKKNLIKLARGFAIIIIFLCSLYLFDKAIINQQTPQFKEYRSWAINVQSLAGRPAMNLIKENIIETGWTQSQFNLFVDLAYADPSIFNDTWLKSGIKITNETSFILTKLDPLTIRLIINNIIKSWNYFIYTFIIFTFVFIFTLEGIKKMFFLMSLFIFLSFHISLGLFFQNVSRVNIPLLVGFIILISVLIPPSYTKNIFNHVSTLLISVISIFAIINFNSFNNSKLTYNKINSDFIKLNYSKSILIIHGNQEFLQFSNPYSFNKKDELPFVFMIGNWDTFSPHWYQRGLKIGLNVNDFNQEVLSNKRVLWSGPEIPNTTLNFINLLNESGLKVLSFQDFGRLPNGNKVIKIKGISS